MSSVLLRTSKGRGLLTIKQIILGVSLQTFPKNNRFPEGGVLPLGCAGAVLAPRAKLPPVSVVSDAGAVVARRLITDDVVDDVRRCFRTVASTFAHHDKLYVFSSPRSARRRISFTLRRRDSISGCATARSIISVWFPQWRLKPSSSYKPLQETIRASLSSGR